MFTASQLVHKGARPKATTATFEVREDQGIDEDGRRVYTFPLPKSSTLSVRLDVGSFATQAVEPGISAEENKVAWTEGLSITPGELPTILVGGNSADVPVFSHEIAIVEGVTGDSPTRKCFKLGIVPRFNEISTVTAYTTAGTLVQRTASAKTTVVAGASWATTYFVTLSNGQVSIPHAAPHYGKPFQDFVAAGNATGMRFSLEGATSKERVDCLDSGTVTFAGISTAVLSDPYLPVADAQMTGFTVPNSDDLFTGADPESLTMEVGIGGFLVCSPWFVSDIVSFLNYQLDTVEESQFDNSTHERTGDALSCCHTTGERPVNRYRFEQVGGRVQLVRTSGTESFTVYWNTNSFGNYAYHSVQNPTGDGTSSSKTPAIGSIATCPTGHAATSASNLWSALGFSTGTPDTFDRDRSMDLKGGRTTATAYGIRAGTEHAGIFETAIAPGYYSAQTFANSVTTALNQHRVAGSASVPNAPSAAFTFVDSTKVSRTAVITAGQRTPHQLAEAVCFVLNRLDSRGVYSQTRENYTVHEGDARLALQEQHSTVTAGQKLLWYRVVYDKDVKKFTIENREISEYRFAAYDADSPSDTYPYPTVLAGDAPTHEQSLDVTAGYPIVQYPDTVSRAVFSISFRAGDLQYSSVLSGTTLDTAAAARMLGFVPERAYSGTQIVSESATFDACYPTLLTRGMPGAGRNNEAYALYALDSASFSGYFHQNRINYRGTGPDSHVYPRFVYAVTGSEINDKKYTVTARHPNPPTGSLIPGRKVATGNDISNDVTLDTSTVTSTGSNEYLSGNPSINVGAGGNTNYMLNTLLVVDNEDDTGDGIVTVTGVTGTALNTTGPVGSMTMVYRGEGANSIAATEAGLLMNANGPLRIVDGSPPTNQHLADDNWDNSRIVVQCGLAAESSGVYRTTQGHLPFQVGDFVELGPNNCIIVGEEELGEDVAGHAFNVQRVTVSGSILQGAPVITAATDYAKIKVGMHFRVLQGDCGTVIKCTAAPDSAATTYSFAYVSKGTGHSANAAVQLFGPIPLYLSGLIEEVMQVPYRHRYQDVPDTESAFNARKTFYDYTSASASFTSCSLNRDGSLLKIRLPNTCTYNTNLARIFPSNLGYIKPVDPVRFQLLNHDSDVRSGFKRADTVWSAFGLAADSDIGRTIKMPGEWNLTAVSGVILTLENDIGFEETHEYFTQGRKLGSVLAKIDYNSAVSRTWGVVHARTYTARNLKEIRMRVLDRHLRDFDFGGRSFTVSFNVHQF